MPLFGAASNITIVASNIVAGSGGSSRSDWRAAS